MKRDLDLARKLMETFEALPGGKPITSFSGEFGSASKLDVMEHIALLCDAGLLQGECHPEYKRFVIHRITWAGHDFLDAGRDEDVWQTARKRLKQAGSWTFELVLETLKEEARRRLASLIS